jgi:integrase
MYTDLLDKRLSRTTVNNIHGVFHKALDQALRWGLVNRNVTEMVDAPKKAKPELTVGESGTFIR